MKSADVERVLKAVTMKVCSRDIVGCFDSKAACKSALFLCLLLAGGCDELAVEDGLGGCKMASLEVGGLV